MSEIAHPIQNSGDFTLTKIENLQVLYNFILLIALSNMAINIVRVIKILTGDVCGKECQSNGWGYANWFSLNDRFRGQEMLCYSAMVYIHSRLYTAVVEDDQETINVWLTVNMGLTVIQFFPDATYPSLWGNDFHRERQTLVGVLVLDFVQYGAIYEYRRLLNKSKHEAAMASSQNTTKLLE